VPASIESSSVRISSAASTDVLPFLTLLLGPAHRVCGIGRHDLAGDEPMEEHADGGQVLLDARLGQHGAELLDLAGDVDRLNVLKTKSFLVGPF
jgi:hypothetical protein